MRKTKIISALVLAVLLFSLLSVISLAEEQRVYDGNGILSSAQMQSLESSLAEAESKSGIPHKLVIDDGIYNSYSREDKLLSRIGFRGGDDLIVLLIGHDGFEWRYELFTYGEGYDALSDSAVDRILDDPAVYDNIKEYGNVYEGAAAFAVASPREMERSRSNAFVAVIVVSVILALLCGGGAVGYVVYKYKRKLKSPIYPVSQYATMSLEHSNDAFIGSNVVRTRVASSSRGGGGSRGGGSRGGR